MLAAKQIQPMKDREMGTKMAMLQPSTGLLMVFICSYLISVFQMCGFCPLAGYDACVLQQDSVP